MTSPLTPLRDSIYEGILEWMPWSLCLDSAEDRAALARGFVKEFGGKRAKVLDILEAHDSLCTDTQGERERIAGALMRCAEAWK